MTKVISIIALCLVTVVGVGYFLALGSGKPISSDLSLVGKGQPSYVLAYENYNPNSGEALNRLRNIKSDYESRLNFVVADLGTPQGRQFASRYNLINAQAVFLTSDGQPLDVTAIPEDEAQLRSNLDARLAESN